MLHSVYFHSCALRYKRVFVVILFVVCHPGFVETLLVTHSADDLSTLIDGTLHLHKVVPERLVLNLVGNKVSLNGYCSRFNSANEWR